MTPIPPYQPGQSVSDYLTSVIRTAVPVLWGALITYLITLVPAVAHIVDPANVVGLGPAVAAVLAGAWYALMRKIEPMLPAWLTMIVLGSNKQPTYVPTGSVVVPAGIQPPAAPPGAVTDGRAD
jgi:hypothetical protein